jgi:spore germination cell wall hydrolase CwlJ-like protein
LGGASFVPLDDQPPAKADVIDRDILSEAHEYCLALAVYFEGGSTGESETGQRHIARVVVERAKANKPKWGGTDLCDVVFHKRAGVCQFSFACLPSARRSPRGGAAWNYSLAIARDELAGRSSVTERSIRYYMNAALTPDRNACRFRREFVPVVSAGRHQFFREPTRLELLRLAKSEPVECQRHARALKASKRKAKARGKHKRYATIVRKKKTKKLRHARR